MLTVSNISISSGNFALESINFTIESEKCMALLGPSGSGKTTIMEAICGLRAVTHGNILIDSTDITELRPAERQVALVPQDNALFPHLTVGEHLSFGPTIQKWKKSDIKARVEELAEELGITHLLHRKPVMLSGGEAKRVALARALATKPKLLCLDEALTGLDEKTHAATLQVIRSTITREKTTTLLITHSIMEAQALADSIIELDNLLG